MVILIVTISQCQLYCLYVYCAQYVVIPSRRSSAAAVQILISHIFGDAGSPFLVGSVRIIYIASAYLFVSRPVRQPAT